MPQLVRLYIKNCLIGFAIAGLFVGIILGLDVANLRHLVFATSGGWIAALILFVCSGTIFAGVQFGYAVMGLAEDKEPPRGGLRQHASLQQAALIPVRVEASVKRKPR